MFHFVSSAVTLVILSIILTDIGNIFLCSFFHVHAISLCHSDLLVYNDFFSTAPYIILLAIFSCFAWNMINKGKNHSILS